MLPAYTAAKAALTSVSKNLSLLLAKDEILVNVVSPGSIASESLVGWATSVGVDGNDPYQLMDAMPNTSGIRPICHELGCRTKRVQSSHFWRHGATRT
jgi:3-oxoacyl-[acyl-carrier protein] reductase